MNKVYLLLLLLFCVGFVSGVKPLPQFNLNSGLEVVYPKAQAYSFGEDFNVYIMVTNISTGKVIDSANCTLYISNHTNNDIVFGKNFSYYGSYIFNVSVESSSFFSTGFYPYAIICIAGDVGGFVSDEILISGDGSGDLSEGNGFFAVVIVLLPLLMAWLLFRWGDGLGEDFGVLRLGVSLIVLVLPFVSLWFATLGVVKFFFWDGMVDALTFFTRVYGLIVLFVMLLLLVLFVKSVFDRIAGRRKGDYSE